MSESPTYYLELANKALRDECNKVSTGFINSAEYQAIVNHYIGQLVQDPDIKQSKPTSPPKTEH